MRPISITHYTVGAVIVLFSCFLLGYIDHETKSVADLFKPSNLFALILYFVPTYAISMLLYNLFQRRNNKNSLALALVVGIPVGFTVVVVTLALAMGRI